MCTFSIVIVFRERERERERERALLQLLEITYQKKEEEEVNQRLILVFIYVKRLIDVKIGSCQQAEIDGKQKIKYAGTGTKATIVLKVASSKDILRSDTSEKLKKIS